MIFKWKMEGVTNLKTMIQSIPIKSRKVLRKAGNIFIEELDMQVAKLTRAKRHKFRASPTKSLLGSFSLRSVSDDELQIQTSVPHAGIVDEGGVITSPNMTVPISGMYRSNTQIEALQNAKKTFVRNDMIFLRSSKAGEDPELLMVLKDSVTIPAAYYSDKAKLKATPRIIKLFNDAIKEATG